MKTLVIGGTHGVGLEIARLFAERRRDKNTTFITGRNFSKVSGRNELEKNNCFFLDFKTPDQIETQCEELFREIGPIDLLVYGANHFSEGRIETVSIQETATTMLVGLIAPQIIVSKVLQKQKTLAGLITITATPKTALNEKRVGLATVQAGLTGMMQALSLDGRIKKILLASVRQTQKNDYRKTSKAIVDIFNNFEGGVKELISLSENNEDTQNFRVKSLEWSMIATS